ncbi:MAG: GlsB/YeaQ/YmgE family stress response membrane protein [Candidatus Saccharimonadales bacterium]
MVNIILWIVFGALTGWIASKIMNTDEEQGAIGNIVVGIIGAFIGGFLLRSLTDTDTDTFSLGGLVVAIVGAVILLAIVKMFRGGGRRRVE